VPCSLSNELDGNVPELVIVRDNAYLEVAQAIQFVRTKSRRKQIHARPLTYRGVPLKSVVPCSLSNELDGNVPGLVIVRDNAYLEVAQAIQFVRTKSRRKQIHARPLAYRGVPLKSVVTCSLSNELDGNVPELVIVPRLKDASPRQTDGVCFDKWESNDRCNSNRPLFYEGQDDYNHFVIENTLREAMSDPRYTRLDACRAWNDSLVHKVAPAEQRCRPIESDEASVNGSEDPTVRPDLLSIASIGSFDSDEVDEIFESIDW
jgi:hypothetical protein